MYNIKARPISALVRARVSSVSSGAEAVEAGLSRCSSSPREVWGGCTGSTFPEVGCVKRGLRAHGGCASRGPTACSGELGQVWARSGDVGSVESTARGGTSGCRVHCTGRHAGLPGGRSSGLSRCLLTALIQIGWRLSVSTHPTRYSTVPALARALKVAAL